jgi:polygalacturonase
MLNRRELIGFIAASGIQTPLSALANQNHPEPWDHAFAIEQSFKKPFAFRQKKFSILDFGARPCELRVEETWVAFEKKVALEIPKLNTHDSYEPINQAIRQCHEDGGGQVLIPSGHWLCNGPIRLLSNVNLHLEKNTFLFFGNNPRDYAKDGDYDCGPNGKLTLSRWEGNDLLNFSPLIYAYQQHNIALTGEDWTSIIDGQGGVNFENDTDCWWSWKGRAKSAFLDTDVHVTNKGLSESHVNEVNPKSLLEVVPHLSPEVAHYLQGTGDKWRKDPEFLRTLAESGVKATERIFGLGHYLRPHMIQFIDCKKVLLSHYQVRNTPFWQHNPVHCEHLHVNAVFANGTGPNNDGLNPESCDGVLIENCEFNTGDDCIAIESGKGPDIQYGPSQNILIQRCKMQSGHGGLTLGSVMSGGIQNIYARDLIFQNKNYKTDPLNIAIRFKSNLNRGGFIKNVYIKNISIPNGIRTTPGFYKGLSNSFTEQKIATNSGAVITIDCGYDPAADNVRTRPPSVSNIHISNIKVGNIHTPQGQHSSYQTLVILGPIAIDYNAKDATVPAVLPVENVVIQDCDFGSPINSKDPIFLFNAKHIELRRVKIGTQLYSSELNSST